MILESRFNTFLYNSINEVFYNTVLDFTLHIDTILFDTWAQITVSIFHCRVYY